LNFIFSGSFCRLQFGKIGTPFAFDGLISGPPRPPIDNLASGYHAISSPTATVIQA
jgi:hypothetical protein